MIDPLSLLPRYPQFGQAPTICVTLAVFSLYKRVDIYITLMFTLKLADVGCGEIKPRQDQRNKFCGHESSSSSRSMIHPTYYVYALKKKKPRYHTAMAYSLAILLDRPFKRIRLEFMLVH